MTPATTVCPPKVFGIVMHHLAPDASAAALTYPDVTMSDVTPDQLRRLIDGLVGLAAKVEYPVAPELRVTAPDGQFVIQVKQGHVVMNSWAVRSGATDLSPAEIFAAITGVEPGASEPGARGGRGAVSGPQRQLKVALLALGIIGSNAVTAWMLTRPPPDLLPAHEFLPEGPASRVLANVAGIYETGSASGDRRLEIARDGAVKWAKFGDGRALVEESAFTAVAVQVGGQPALLTSERTIVEIKDPITVVLYGDTYRRAAP
jgi:hypothetical protein